MAKQLKIELIVDDKGSVHVKKFADTTDKSMKKAQDSTSRLQKAVVGLVSAYGALQLGRMAADWVKLYGVQEQAEAQLKQAMISMGRYSEESFQSTKHLASGLQQVTTFGDEATMAGQKFLMTYKDIPDDLMPRTTRAMLDLAALMGGDTKQAANMLGKASMGLAGELRRVGITIDEDIGKSGDFSKILAEIEKQVGGQARALAETGYGGLQQYGNLIGDVKEDLGKLSMDIVNVFEPAISSWLGVLKETAEYWSSVMGGGSDPVLERLQDQKRALESMIASNSSWINRLFGHDEDNAVLQKRLDLVNRTIELITGVNRVSVKGPFPTIGGGGSGSGGGAAAGGAGAAGKEEDIWSWQMEMATAADSAYRTLEEGHTAAYISELDKRKEADMELWNWQYEMAEASDATYRAMEEERTANYIAALEKRKEATVEASVYETETLKNMIMGMQSEVAGFFGDVFRGELKSAKEYFKSFANTLANIFAQMCAKMILEWIAVRAVMAGATGGLSEAMGGGAGGLGSIIGGGLGMFHTGGMGYEPRPTRRVPALAFAGARRAHTGLAGDERPVIIRRNEGVFTDGQMKALGLMIGQGAGGGDIHIQVNIDGREAGHAIAARIKSDRYVNQDFKQGLGLA